jgi:chemotaxis protein methyltransferase CheR
VLEDRLKRRMAKLNLASCSEYCKYLFADDRSNAEELIQLIDVVTTNKTDFFREKAHFDFLQGKVLPDLRTRIGDNRELLIWSAGCSRGEEPYTLAIVLNEYKEAHPGFRFRILATDISTTVLDKAESGIFPSDVVAPVPPHLIKKYFMRSRNHDSNLLRVIPELREMIEFRRLNLMEEFGIAELVDAIFCRNVAIYFDQSAQKQLFWKFSRQLVDGGYLFLGHSESLHHMDVPLTPVAPALYKKTASRPKKQASKIGTDLQIVHLEPGEVHFARNPVLLKTILGSCIGVAFWNPVQGVGALCHGVLPKCPKGITGKEGYRYVDFAIRDLAKQFEDCGAHRADLQVKVFGGADVLSGYSTDPQRATVGQQNCQTALEVLQDENLTLLVSDIGGSVGRAIQFDTGSGEVRLRRLIPSTHGDVEL